MNCILCDQPTLISVASVSSRRLRFTEVLASIPAEVTLYRCSHCGHVQKVPDSKSSKWLSTLYKNYNAGNYSFYVSQAVFGQALPETREEYVLKQCDQLRECKSLLDIGSGPGTFLQAAAAHLPSTQLFAFDVADQHRENILQVPQVEQFFCGQLQDIAPKKFDAVVIWHSFEHMVSPRETLNVIKKLLNPKGKLLVQVPDLRRMVFDLTLSEHFSHFTSSILRSFIESAGFRLLHNGDDWIHNSCTQLFEMQDFETGSECSSDFTLSDLKKSVQWLEQVREYFERASYGKAYGIFGTGTAAGWLHGVLSGIPLFFVDEDPARVGCVLDTFPVVPVSQIKSDQLLLMPAMPEFSESLKSKLLKRNPHLSPEQIVIFDQPIR